MCVKSVSDTHSKQISLPGEKNHLVLLLGASLLEARQHGCLESKAEVSPASLKDIGIRAASNINPKHNTMVLTFFPWQQVVLDDFSSAVFCTEEYFLPELSLVHRHFNLNKISHT